MKVGDTCRKGHSIRAEGDIRYSAHRGGQCNQCLQERMVARAAMRRAQARLRRKQKTPTRGPCQGTGGGTAFCYRHRSKA